MLYILLGIVVASILVSVLNWRHGLFAMILIVAVQDPIRKLVPDAPGALSMATIPVLIAIVIGLISSQKKWWQDFKRIFPKVNKRLNLLLLTLIPAALLSATYGPGSWLLTIFGAFSYGIIFLAILVGFYFPRSADDIRRLLAGYALMTAPLLTGAFIQYFDLMPGSTLIGTEALNFDWIRYSDGYVVDLIAGFYRSPDIMGWHAATTAIFSFNLSLTAKGSRRWFWLGICAVGVAALFFCGRRKMFYMLPVFVISLLWMYWQAGRPSKAITIVGLMAIPLVGMVAFGDWLGPDATFLNYYADHATDTYNQLEGHSFRALVRTVRQSGFFGSGLGVAAPGSHHLPVARPRVWQESGPSRIMVELGVPGFCAMLSVIAGLITAAWAQVKPHIRVRSPLGYYAAGMFAFFFTNVCSLMVSGQILADPFIASFLGISIGMTLAAARFPLTLPQAIQHSYLHPFSSVPYPHPSYPVRPNPHV